MTAYVLVGGAWLGGWCWDRVADRLRADGHEVYPVTLTGLGDRSHLAAPEVDLDTHIADVVTVIESADRPDVVLFGHSYAGVVVTGVADRIPESISLLGYLDSGPASDGTAYVDFLPPPARELIDQLVEEVGGGWQIPMPSWEELAGLMGSSLSGLGDAERANIRAGAVPQPVRTWTQSLSLKNPARKELPKLLISCSFPLAEVREMIAAGHPWFRELAAPQWSFLELRTSHWPMFSAPERLAALLASIPAGLSGSQPTVSMTGSATPSDGS
jgi:pimeloyl-ACP methyl ester carboxylesterase